MKEEKKIVDAADPVSIEGTKRILNQLMNCICKIKIKGEFGTGFFCKIPFRNETKKVFMTNYHVLNDENLEDNEKINLLINDEKKVSKLDLGIDRNIYFNKEYDVTLIEIKEEDEIKDFLELDNNLFQDEAEIIYINKSIYVLQYPNGKNACVSYGLLSDMDQYKIRHKCTTDFGSSGSPILNLDNNKVIGIHSKGSISFNFNMGTLLKLPIQDFINKALNSNIKKNTININNVEYNIIKEIGSDGFGRVIQVSSNSDNKNYAVKVIPITEETKNQFKNIQNEVEILSNLNCNNIVKYYDSSKDEKIIHILMEYCGENNLRSFIKKYINNKTFIEENIIKKIIKQICLGLKEIHNKKISHRDLKPENIFMNENMDIKIGDFGLSKQLKSYKEYELSNSKAGSEDYIAPEIKFKGIYNEKSDMWSLGCIIYELFTLNIYYKDNFMTQIRKIDTKIYNSKWQNLIDSLLQLDYAKRIDINQVYKALEDELNININHKNTIKNIENEIKNMNINDNKNIIIGVINIKKEDINKNIKIINSFENVKRERKKKNKDDDWKYENEKEIKENIEIKINGKLIDFAYYYKFDKEEKYIIEYSFKNNLTKTCYMFYGCNLLTNLNLSNFKSKNVINMCSMFLDCSSLLNLNLSNINTENVTDMSNMFYYCEQLKSLDLSNFNTKKVINMSGMFYHCNSLTNLVLSNFNTENVTDMREMFSLCSSLMNLDLSNFNTQNVKNMSYIFNECCSLQTVNLLNFNTLNVKDMSNMFYYCYSLTNLDLSKFNTKKVTDMREMFFGCSSLTNLNLSNFNTLNTTDMDGIFNDCYSLKKENIITKDEKILEEFIDY